MTSDATETPPTQPTPPTRRNPEGDFPTGPDLGEVFPDFTLPNQHGEPVTLSEARGGERALLMFYRSARW